MHPVKALFAAMRRIEPYPPGVVRVPTRIPGTAFFPGGYGLWGVRPNAALPPMPIGGVMVLGHDFHSEEAFAHTLRQGTEVPATRGAGRIVPTWSGLCPVLCEAGLPLDRCFFTNAYMGLRQGAGVSGRFPGSRDPQFVKRCQSFFLRQVEVQRPAVLLTLGRWVPAFVAPLSPRLAPWLEVRSLADVDDKRRPVVLDVKFDRTTAPTCSVVALTHPSVRGPSVPRRRFGSLTGHPAEIAMIKKAVSASRFERSPA